MTNTIPLSELLAKLPVPSSDVKWQSLRRVNCDPRCGEHWEVHVGPIGGGNTHAIVYSSHANMNGQQADCLQRAALLAHAVNNIGPLVAALESVLQRLDSFEGKPPLRFPDARDKEAMNNARAVLTAAKTVPINS